MSWRAAFSAQDWAQLYGPLQLRVLEEGEHLDALPPRALFEPRRCDALLALLGPVIGAPTPAITASLLVKRFAFLATGASLYAMSACNRGLQLTPDNCLLDYQHDGRRWVSVMPVSEQAILTAPVSDAAREVWRAEVVRGLFANLLAPLLESLHQSSGIARRILWDNTAARVYSLYEKRIGHLADPQSRARVQADFDWLLGDAPAALFGLTYNPLQHFRRAPTQLPDGRCIRFRRTCCFYYQASDPVEYCTACPLLRPKRARRSADGT